MANYKKKEAAPSITKETTSTPVKSSGGDDFSAELIRDINKEVGSKIMFNLGAGDAPTVVHRWISTGSKQLDYIIGNLPGTGGGLPEGRIVEIQGPTGCGKSHIAFEIAKATQRQGGLVVYIDTENATSIENLEKIGIDVRKRFAFVQTSCTEDIFAVIEKTINKARSMNLDIPVTVIWDSVANSSPKAELEGDYDQNTIGLQARVLGKGFRKITNVIGGQHVLLVCLQQQREKIGVMYGDPTTTPGGKALPYACSVRIKIGAGAPLKKTVEGKERVIGIGITAKVIKNRMSNPFREVEMEIHFGKGVKEHEQVFDYLRDWCSKHEKNPVVVNGNKLLIEGMGGWKTFSMTDAKTDVLVKEVKFNKSDFGPKVLYNPEFKQEMQAFMDAAYIMTSGDTDHLSFTGVDTENPEELAEAQGKNESPEE